MKKLNKNKYIIIIFSIIIVLMLSVGFFLSLKKPGEKIQITKNENKGKEQIINVKKDDYIEIPTVDISNGSTKINEPKKNLKNTVNKKNNTDGQINNTSKGKEGTKEEIQKKTRPLKRPSDAKDEVIYNSNNQGSEDISENEESNNNEEVLNPGNIQEEVKMEGEWGNIIANMR
ncbi:hypothetical protein ACPMCT_17295 [Clostridioides difficile]|uniref:hypothetical protein n=1 Tax=Clostridioides difficile TaxID=1496 RepID=UPI00038D9889|nr:hypothetical protein [Clostridioides difficile]EQJ94787.1 hypothetical protein QUA_0942 [Clostridioides difficile P49]MBY1861063.1 hypothetical protein [Clostridioides difficile]MBZ0706790.1 hypothetical protein [Clostridioides difficile]MCH7327257.1 hypothetical protein [Clostridioides difficile]MCI4737408.1 hypothetical protein [Clostridioides difficile]